MNSALSTIKPSYDPYTVLGRIIDNQIPAGSLNPSYSNSKINFLHGHADSEEAYAKNLKTQPENWYYRNNTVEYTFNKDGYRTKDFDKINWEEAIVLFGCSTVLGEAVDDKDTLSSYLNRITEKEVVNLGMSGSSIAHAVHLSTIVSKKYPTPKAVVFLWTEMSRTAHYREHWIKHYIINNKEPEYVNYYLSDENHMKAMALFYKKMAQEIWFPKTKFFDCSYFYDTASLVGCEYLGKLKDKGRDLSHPGRETNKFVAELIASRLNLTLDYNI